MRRRRAEKEDFDLNRSIGCLVRLPGFRGVVLCFSLRVHGLSAQSAGQKPQLRRKRHSRPFNPSSIAPLQQTTGRSPAPAESGLRGPQPLLRAAHATMDIANESSAFDDNGLSGPGGLLQPPFCDELREGSRPTGERGLLGLQRLLRAAQRWIPRTDKTAPSITRSPFPVAIGRERPGRSLSGR